MTGLKIAICTPYYGQIPARFLLSQLAMIKHTEQTNFTFNGQAAHADLQVIMNSSSLLGHLRNKLVKGAIDWGANYLLWLDADHTFPPDTLVRLLSRGLPVVGANYPRRTLPTGPTARSLENEDLWTTPEKAEAGEVEQVGRLGMGVCLMDMTVLDRLEQAARAEGRETFWPLFSQETQPGSVKVMGEDTFFFRRLMLAGIAAYVDHALSWEVGHIFETVLTNADALAQRDAYLADLAATGES
jgi:hypothetical protein